MCRAVMPWGWGFFLFEGAAQEVHSSIVQDDVGIVPYGALQGALYVYRTGRRVHPPL